MLGNLVVRADYVSADAKQKDHVLLLHRVKVSKRAHVLQIVGQKTAQSSCIRSGLLFCVEFSDFDSTYVPGMKTKTFPVYPKNPTSFKPI